MDSEKLVWHGASGNEYEFSIHGSDARFKDLNGNYIFAKKTDTGWDAVYIGQGNLRDRANAHRDDGCVIRKGATHIHAHVNRNEAGRISEERDLLALHTEAYEPTGCNVKMGG